MSLINAYTYNDKELLLEQIGSINPDIIISCGTFDQLVWLLNLHADVREGKFRDDKKTRYPNPIRSEKHNLWVVAFRHPARITDIKKSYDDLKELMVPLLRRTSSY